MPLTGFDRLREAGFSEDEITNIRAQFHNDTLGSPTTETAGILEREEQEAQARQLEEQWMEGLGAGGVDPSSRKLARPEAATLTNPLFRSSSYRGHVHCSVQRSSGRLLLSLPPPFLFLDKRQFWCRSRTCGRRWSL